MLHATVAAMLIAAGVLLTHGYHPIFQPYPFGFTIAKGTVVSYARVVVPCSHCVRYEIRCDFVCARSDRGCRNALCRDLCMDGHDHDGDNGSAVVCHVCVLSVAVRTRTWTKTVLLKTHDTASQQSCKDGNTDKNATSVLLYLDNTTGLPLDRHMLAGRVAAAYVLLFILAFGVIFRGLLRSCVRRRVRTPTAHRYDENEADVGDSTSWSVVRTKIE